MNGEGQALRVLAVTSWGGACGIANYCDLLKQASVPLGVEIMPDASALDPSTLGARVLSYDLLWLNYHAGLHSRWTPTQVSLLREAAPQLPMVITYHDTYDGDRSANSDNAKALAQLADAFIVHEPVADIPEAQLIRQGIPRPQAPFRFREGAYPGQPMLGTAGFDFPWKNFTRLAELTAEIGWAFLCISNNLTGERERELLAINPYLVTADGFLPTEAIVSALAACTATAWMYETHNTGTSGAIRLGIAALRPCFALRSCRQFRDLLQLPYNAVEWVDTWADLKTYLTCSDWTSGAVAGSSVALYTTDSWDQQAKKYQAVFQAAVAKRAGVRA